MLSFIENFLKSLSSDGITEFFFWILIGITVAGLFAFLVSRHTTQSRFAKFAEYAPVLLTSVGILGTFSGIVAGLLNFDIQQIDSSIGTLLGGMKTAFLTSVIGVTLSILLKITYTLIGKTQQKRNQGLDAEALAAAIYRQADESEKQTAHFETLLNLQKSFQNDSLTALNNMEKSLGSEAEGSLLGQLKLLRADFNDNQKTMKIQQEQAVNLLEKMTKSVEDNRSSFAEFEKNLFKQMQDFAEMLSKSATDAVIEALKQVIVDFNQNLTEQFGENFKELNRAVMALVQWQENYKNQLNEMIVLYNAGVQSLDKTEKSVAEIEQKSQSIPAMMEKLGGVIEINQHQIDNLNAHLGSFVDLRDKAIEAVPQTQSQIQLMLDNVTKGNEALTQALQHSAQQMEADLAQTAKAFGEKAVGLSENLANLITTAGNQFSEQSEKANRLLGESGKGLQETADSIREHQKAMNKEQKKATDQLMQFVENWQKTFETKSQELHSHFVAKVEEMVRKQTAENDRLIRSLQEEGERAVKGVGENVNAQLKLIDESMQREVERVMQQMGNALATISRQFTTDYTKLVEAMGNIVRSRM